MEELLTLFLFFLVVFSAGMILLIIGVIVFAKIPYWFDQLARD